MNKTKDLLMKREGIRLRHLAGETCLEAETLWREVFSEDTESFTAYYFSKKAALNKGLVLEGEDGICSMLYLTPERMQIMGTEADSAYIVGVATRESCRHRGYMAFLLKEAMHMLFAKELPFVFLMPASPAIYEPFGFTWIYDRPVWDAASLKQEKLTVLQEKDADRMAAFASEFLRREKKVYISHDRAYYIQQMAERKAQDGCIFGYEETCLAEVTEEPESDSQNGRQLKGICMYAREDGKPEIVEVLASEDVERSFVHRCPQKKPVIMARILCAERMLTFWRSTEPVEFVLSLTDPLLRDNNGKFFCSVQKNSAYVRRCKEEERDGVSMDITELTAIMFGYRKPENGVLSKLLPCCPVWINEIV